jgi:hypothetical protein
MALDVATHDAAALTDSDLDELASMEDAFSAGQLSKAKEDWVLVTTARFGGKLHGFSFSTLERIGGTPCVLIGLMSVKRTSKREQVLRGLMGEAYHRALMAFPDEDVVVGSRFVNADGLEAFRDLDDVTPSPGNHAGGEERAWGRRLAKRYGIDNKYDAKTFVSSNGAHDGYLDFESSKPDMLDPALCALFDSVPDRGGTMIVYGWSMAEQLVKLGKR